METKGVQKSGAQEETREKGWFRCLGSAGGATPLDPQKSPCPNLFAASSNSSNSSLQNVKSFAYRNPDLEKPQSSGEDIENRTCPPDDVREVYRQVLDPLSKYLMHRTTRFYFSLQEWRNTHSLRYAA